MSYAKTKSTILLICSLILLITKCQAMNLIKAVESGNSVEVQRLLDNSKTDPNVMGEDRMTALMIASQNGNVIVVEKLLAHPKTDPNIMGLMTILP